MAGIIGMIERCLHNAGLANFESDGLCDHFLCPRKATNRLNLEIYKPQLNTVSYADGCEKHMGLLIRKKTQEATRLGFSVKRTGVYKLEEDGKNFLRDKDGKCIPTEIPE